MRRLRRIVALVTEAQASEGTRFSVRVHPLCRRCRLYRACVGKLREGLTYEVVRVRRVAHVCPLLRAKMVVVDVVEAPKVIALTSRVVAEGLVTTFRRPACSYRGQCAYREYCRAEGLEDGEKVVVERVLSRHVECPAGLGIKLASVRRLAAYEA